jgi:hypothetical protein
MRVLLVAKYRTMFYYAISVPNEWTYQHIQPKCSANFLLCNHRIGHMASTFVDQQAKMALLCKKVPRNTGTINGTINDYGIVVWMGPS